MQIAKVFVGASQ
jgi:hypothetical protein